MERTQILQELDAEITRLQQARRLLAGDGAGGGLASSGSKKAAFGGNGRRRRVLSAKARKAISDAQKRRWAAQKKAAK